MRNDAQCILDRTVSELESIASEIATEEKAWINARMREISNVAGTLMSMGAGYVYFLLEMYTKQMFADPDFALESLRYAYGPSIDAAPVTLGTFIDSNITLAQQNPDAVVFGIIAGLAHYALFRKIHNAIFNTPSKKDAESGGVAYS